MSKKSILEKAIFYGCLADIAEIVSNDIEFHENEAKVYFEKAYSNGEVISVYDEANYKKQVAKKNAYCEILEALNSL